MATYPAFDVEDLAEYAGAEPEDYDAYAEAAIRRAIFLFKLGTCRRLDTDYPTDSFEAEIAENAILSMADALYLMRPFRVVLASPFSSETIGSYSYSKVQNAVARGIPVGIGLFDAAMNELSICDTINGASVASGGTNVFEFHKTPHDGYGAYYGPGDLNNGDNEEYSRDPSEEDVA